MRTIADILVVDASDEDAAGTLDSLRTATPGSTLFRLTDGREAFHFIYATAGFAGRPTGLPRLVLLEMYLPSMSGIAVLESLRARPSMRPLPVVMWTSASNPLLIEQALQAGASAYHLKPAALDDYHAAMDMIVQQWLPRATAPSTVVSQKSA